MDNNEASSEMISSIDQRSNGLRVPFGRRGNRLYGPSEVIRGKSCDCVCPGCGTALVANKGERKREYFSHWRGAECSGGYESAVHLMAKQVIEDTKQAFCPSFSTRIEKEAYPGHLLSEDVNRESSLLAFDSVKLEQTAEGLRPDIVACLKDGTEIYIEVHVTHAVSDDKRSRFANKNMFEIHLAHLTLEDVQDMERFRHEVLEAAPRDWIACQLHNDEIETARAYLDARVQRYRAEHQARLDEESRKRMEQKHEEAQKLARKHQIAERREQLRQQYHAPLQALRRMVQDDGAAVRNQSLLEGAESSTPAILERLNVTPWPPCLDVPIEGDWILNAHRTIWQAYIYENCIVSKAKNTTLHTNLIKQRIVRQFGLLDWAAALVNLKYRYKQQGKARGQWYGRKGIWFLEDKENAMIPSPYSIVHKFMESLVKEGLLEQAQPGTGLFVIRENNIAALHAARARKDEEHRLAQEAADRKEQAALEAHRAQEQSRLAIARKIREERIQSLIQVITSLKQSGHDSLMRCEHCGDHRPYQDGNCAVCGHPRLWEVHLTESYLSTLNYRLRCVPGIVLDTRSTRQITNEGAELMPHFDCPDAN
ncbi:hypothetical protein [Marinobacterium aestuarii]|nr:hypothetical protein [Marinobacterium aestuarii]